MNPGLLAAIVIVDLAVTAAVLTLILRRRSRAALKAGRLDPRRVGEISREVEARTVDYLRNRWNGDPAALPGAIGALIAELESGLRARQVPLEHEQLRAMVSRTIAARGLADGHDVREAMRQVA